MNHTYIPITALLIFCQTAFHAAENVKPGDSARLVLDADTGITLREGFDAELLYEVPKSQGSWVAMAFDPKGRLIVSDQDDKGVFRVTLPVGGDLPVGIKVESLPGFPFEPIPWGKRTVGGALGFHYAFDSLYMSTMKGFYRVRDTNGDDTFDEFTLLKRLNYGYEHSAHSIIPTADGTGLYLVSGNFTRVPDGTASVQPPVWLEDSLTPSIPDPSGHAVSIKPPGGCDFPAAGYAEFARLMMPMIDHQLYHRVVDGPITPPNLKRAFFTTEQHDELVLEFDDQVVWSDALTSQFHLDGELKQVASGSASGSRITLKLKGPAKAMTVGGVLI